MERLVMVARLLLEKDPEYRRDAEMGVPHGHTLLAGAMSELMAIDREEAERAVAAALREEDT